MRKIFVVALLTGVLTVSACGITKKTLGFANEGPDETKVKTNPPLTLPPEYNVRPQKSVVSENSGEEKSINE